MKYTIKERYEGIRVYEIEAKNAQAALDKMYSGEVDPVDSDEIGSDIFVYDENGKNVSSET